MRLMIGAVSAVTGEPDEEAQITCIQMGRAAARHGMILLTGADRGLSSAATRGAQAAGGMVIGLSPAGSLEEHERVYHLIVDGFDALFFTGVGRTGILFEVIRSVDILVVAGSGETMLTACVLARHLGKLVGVIPLIGATDDTERDEVGAASTRPRFLAEATAGNVFLDDDPVRLVDRLVRASLTERAVRPGVILPPTSVSQVTRETIS